MSTKEIIKTVAVFNKVMELLLQCERINEQEKEQAGGDSFDLIWLQCTKTEYYTNDVCEIMPPFSDDEELEAITCDNLSETAAKYTEIVINAGATESDLYLGY